MASACWQLFVVTLRRQLFSRQALVGIALTILCCLIVLAWSRQREPTPKKLAEQVLVPTFVAFLLPVLAICHGASVIGGEREDRTLIYLLITPIPRPFVYLTKALAALGLVTSWAAVVLTLLCLLGGAPGREMLRVFLPASLLGAAAYTSLFLLLGAVFRHGTIIALAYWFFLEVLFGSLPGIIKRISIAFYVRSVIYDAGSEQSLGPMGRISREMFLAISGDAAAIVLGLGTLALIALGALVFTRREYRDLS
jgi:ABC-type transport system involved in multi-copper enzyme maturation permease subunit